MFKQVFRITFVTFVWKQYKQIIVSTVLLFAYLWLVGGVHADYLSYAELQSDQSLAGKSFIYKWAALISGVLCYLGYHSLRRRKSARLKNKSAGKATAKLTDSEQNDGPDPFAEIRLKSKLRSRSEIMIDKEES